MYIYRLDTPVNEVDSLISIKSASVKILAHHIRFRAARQKQIRGRN